MNENETRTDARTLGVLRAEPAETHDEGEEWRRTGRWIGRRATRRRVSSIKLCYKIGLS